jgi:hypothetical protein
MKAITSIAPDHPGHLANATAMIASQSLPNVTAKRISKNLPGHSEIAIIRVGRDLQNPLANVMINATSENRDLEKVKATGNLKNPLAHSATEIREASPGHQNLLLGVMMSVNHDLPKTTAKKA